MSLQKKSIYDFARKHLARVLFGNDNPGAVRRIHALLNGEKLMTVDVLYTLTKVEPLVDLELSMRDLYERYEIARMRKQRVKKPKEFSFSDFDRYRTGQGGKTEAS